MDGMRARRGGLRKDGTCELHQVHEQAAAGNNRGLPGMLAVAAAASKFKRGCSTGAQVSREKREILKKASGDGKIAACNERCFGELQDIVKPYLNKEAQSPHTHDSDADSDDEEVFMGGDHDPEAVLGTMQGVLDAWCEENLRLCCDIWDVDKQSAKLKDAKHRAAHFEKEAREVHSKSMRELQASKDAMLRAQGRNAFSDVAITEEDIVFYDATEYLPTEQRDILKEMVEYKVKYELSRGNTGENEETGTKLRTKIKEQEKQIEDLRETIADMEGLMESMRKAHEAESRSQMERPVERPKSKEKTDFACQFDEPQPRVLEKGVDVQEWPKETKDSFTETKELISTALATSQTDPIPEPEPRVVYQEKGKAPVHTATAAVQTDPKVPTPRHGADPDMLEQLARAAREAEEKRKGDAKIIAELREENKKLQAALDTERQRLQDSEKNRRDAERRLEEAERNLADAEARLAAMPPPEPGAEPRQVVMKATQAKPEVLPKMMQTDPWEPESSPPPIIQSLEGMVNEEELLALQEEVAKKTRANKQLSDEVEALKRELAALREGVKMPKPGPSSEELTEALSALKEKQRENAQLMQELEDERDKNRKLEIALAELHDKMKDLQEQLRNAGLGDVADRMFDNVGLAEFLKNMKPVTVFERLYTDALRRVKKSAPYKSVAMSRSPQALLATMKHIDSEGAQPLYGKQPLRTTNFQALASMDAQPTLVQRRNSVPTLAQNGGGAATMVGTVVVMGGTSPLAGAPQPNAWPQRHGAQNRASSPQRPPSPQKRVATVNVSNSTTLPANWSDLVADAHRPSPSRLASADGTRPSPSRLASADGTMHKAKTVSFSDSRPDSKESTQSMKLPQMASAQPGMLKSMSSPAFPELPGSSGRLLPRLDSPSGLSPGGRNRGVEGAAVGGAGPRPDLAHAMQGIGGAHTEHDLRRPQRGVALRGAHSHSQPKFIVQGAASAVGVPTH